MLQNFRTIDVIWDLANKNFHETIELSSSDEQGRRIVVQVLDNGQVVDLTGVGLNLYWETKDKHYMGLDNFTALDVRKGLFELYATTELLSNVGTLKGHLYLVTAEGEAITSLPVDINVNQGINTGAVESQNSFSALTGALSRVVAIESQEQQRIDNEITRQQQENDRVDAESQRESTFGDNLVSWNSQYSDAEDARDNQYSDAEDNRDSQYSQAESARDDLYDIAEQTRDNEYAPRLQSLEAKTPGVYEWGIESGENENGSWVKFADGTLICRGYEDLGGADLTLQGSAPTYHSEIRKVTMPVPFVGDFSFRVDIGATRSASAFTMLHGNHETYANYSIHSTYQTLRLFNWYYIAIGRWK